MPHAGHFIGGKNCKFILNTYVGKYIVSTVGELWWGRSSREIVAEVQNPQWFRTNRYLKGDTFDNAYMKEFGYDEVGCGRKYETMVFKARKSTNKCCPYSIDVTSELDFEGYNDRGDATEGHYAMCEKWSTADIDMDDFLTAKQYAKQYRIHPYTAKRLARTGKVPATKVGGQWRFNVMKKG